MQSTEVAKLRSYGFNVMPLRPNEKEPLAGANWTKFQTERYTDDIPESCNVAVICGVISDNLFVVDLDNDTLFDDFKEYQEKTYIVKTGKGYHIYFRSNGLLPQNRKLDDHRFRHIDIKSEGGYVVSAGSIHPETKKPYECISDVNPMLINPQVIKKKLESMGFDLRKKSFDELKQGASEGGRNDGTFKLACYWIREGLYGESLKYEVNRFNKEKNKPPLPDREIEIILKQASGYESKSINKHITEAKAYIERNTDADPIKITMQEIDPKHHEGVKIIFDCMITAVGQRLTYTTQADMECPECGDITTFYCDEYFNFPKVKCKEHKIPYDVIKGTKQTAYIQQLKIEEFLEDAKNSSPVVFDAEITDEDVGEAFMGQRKTLLAKFRSIPQQRGYDIPVFEIIDMKDTIENEGCMPSDEELKSWKDCENFFDRVTASIIPEVMMDIKIIQSMILWGSGGTSLNGKRDLIHSAMIGDAQLGKSELSLRMHKLLVGSGMTVGGKTSGAGLTIGMTKSHNDMLMPKAGFFPQYTGHHTIIDEADKLRQDDQNSCLEVMEQGTATLTKVGIPSMTLPAKCPLLISGNPKGGKFNDKYPAIMDNFNMETPFISRFDLIWVLKDKNDPVLDSTIRKFIRTFKSRKESYMKEDELQRYFTYVQNLTATVPDKLMDKIDKLHAKMRPLNKKDGLPIGWRQYHGIHRLVTACATAHLRTEVTDEDFELVEEIIGCALKTMNMDIKTGEVGEVVPEKQTKEKVFLEACSKVMDPELDNSFDLDELKEELIKSTKYFNALTADQEFRSRLEKGEFTMDNDTGRFYRVGV